MLHDIEAATGSVLWTQVFLLKYFANFTGTPLLGSLFYKAVVGLTA